MLKCPKCSGKLVYDIASKGMLCSACGQLYVGRELEGFKHEARMQKKLEDLMIEIQGAEGLIPAEDRGIKVFIYTCPDCGREIVSDSAEELKGCSFCGSPKQLQGRDSAIHRPSGIIPFKITKEECMKRYNKFVRRHIYRPSGLIRKDHKDGFRPIYMPFRSYSFAREGRFTFKGVTRTEGEQNAVITTYYTVLGKLKSNFTGLTTPGTEVMYNLVAEQIEPFHDEEAIPFEENYLAGFYAAMENYDQIAARQKMAKYEPELILREARGVFADVGLNESHARKQLIGQEQSNVSAEEQVHLTPVWYMPYRMGDRISYAMVNGQTGKVAADLPVSKWKVLFYSLIAAVPLFFLFRLTGKTTPSFVFFLISLAAMIMSWVYSTETRDTYRKQVGYLIPSVFQKPVDIASWCVAGLGAVLLFTYGHPEWFVPLSGYSAGTVSAVLRIIVCLLSSGLVTYRFWEVLDRYTAVSDLQYTKPNIICVVISWLATVLYCLNLPKSIVFYILAYAAAAYLVIAEIYLIDTHNSINTTKIKPVKKEWEDEA
ncbi:MAG: hypothetical protein J5643_05910 [Lachnospiraceae bacterium]|nr:hypothetical protein [Lachnospiraceae bacterium]